MNLQKEVVDVSPPGGGGKLVGMVSAAMPGLAGQDVDKGGVLGDGRGCVAEQGVDYPCVESPGCGVESGLNFVKGLVFVEAQPSRSPILLVNGLNNLSPPHLGLSYLDREGSKKGNRALLHFRDAEDGLSADVFGGGVVSPPR